MIIRNSSLCNKVVNKLEHEKSLSHPSWSDESYDLVEIPQIVVPLVVSRYILESTDFISVIDDSLLKHVYLLVEKK